MNASIQRITIGSTGRWPSWAKALAASRPSRRPGVIRRRGPLEMALRRRTRLASWIALRNILSVNLEEKFPVFNAVRLRLALYWSSPLASIPGNVSGRSFAQDRSPMLLELKTTRKSISPPIKRSTQNNGIPARCCENSQSARGASKNGFVWKSASLSGSMVQRISPRKHRNSAGAWGQTGGGATQRLNGNAQRPLQPSM